MKVFIHNEILCTGWQYLQGFEEFDEGVLLIFGKVLKGLAFWQGFAVMPENRLA